MNKILGLDLGSKTVGIAMSDGLLMYAHGVETFRFEENHYQKACDYVVSLVDKNQIQTVVLGMPKHMNGDIGERGKISLKFKQMLERARPIKVELIDERMTSVMMERSLIGADVSRKKRKQVIDKMAAVAILQSYLDRLAKEK